MHKSKDEPNMSTFCDWLSETIVISVYDSFFRNYISIVLLSSIVLSSQSQRMFIWVRGNPCIMPSKPHQNEVGRSSSGRASSFRSI